MTTMKEEEKPLIQSVGKDLWIVDGPVVSFFGCPYPTRMAIIRLQPSSSIKIIDNEKSQQEEQKMFWIWSPTALTNELHKELSESEPFSKGKIAFIVSPNKIHHLFLEEWQKAYPEAKLFAPPGLMARTSIVSNIQFHGTLEETKDSNRNDESSKSSPQEYAHLPWDNQNDIRLVIFKGSFFMEEVVFYHVPSQTLLVADLIQRFPEEFNKSSPFIGWLMKVDGLVGPKGSTPREWRFSFLLGKDSAKAARDTIVQQWKPKNLLIAHGDCVWDGTASCVVNDALKWLDQFHALW